MHRQRLNELHQLAMGVLGANASIQGMVDHLDNISVVIRDRITIWGQLQSDMGALCRFAGWHVPEEFVVYPTINSPAALLYWRILLYLLEQLQESDRAEFSQSYGAQRPKGSTGAIPSGKSLRDSAQPEVVPRHTESQLVEEQDPQRTRGWSGGAKVLGKLSVPGRPTNLEDSRARAYCACSGCGWGCLDIFFSHLSFLFSFSLSLGDGPI